jgi:ATP-binding cassette subfamily F protein 3
LIVVAFAVNNQPSTINTQDVVLMPIVTLSNIEKSFGDRVIFRELNFLIDRGERVGLIGDNGTGKTTLFKVITGEVQPEIGNVAISKSIKLGHLTQDAVFDAGNTVMDEAELAFSNLHQLSHDLRELEHDMAVQSGETLERTLEKYQIVQHEFDLAGGYAWRHKLEATLLGVGIPQSMWEQNVETLSGGQRSKLNLAKLLISQPDLLLLDEPTNHLDLTAIEWLEKYLLDFDGAVLLISHDRFLLDRLATRIVWLTKQKLQNYPGNYSAFLEQKAVQELSQQRAYELQQEDIEKQKEFVRRFGAGQRAREAKGREKRLNRLLKSDAMIDAVTVSKKIHLSIDTDRRAGDRVLEVRELSKSFPLSLLAPPLAAGESPAASGGAKTLWKDVKFEIKRGERIGIIGPNGSGKTTLLRALMGEEETDTGVIRWGANLGIGYYDQRLDDFDPERSIIEEVADGRVVKDQVLRDTLATMLFRGDDIFKPMGLLSGGERARVALAELLLDKPNVLVLDEPTNHLDINSREALENALAGFGGTIICVSHDRYFLEKTVRRLLILDPPAIRDFEGRYSAYLAKLSQAPSPKVAKEKAKPSTSAPTKPKAKQANNPYARRFGRLSTEELEQQIGQTEKQIVELQHQFGDADAFKDPTRGKELHEQYETLTKMLAEMEEEYFTRENQ